MTSVMDQSSGTAGGSVNETPGTNVNEASDAKSSRKRTKTGCLTCRQRRIKCGEERPICQNCVKSKRDCQGYNQRVIFKEPLNALRPPASVSRQAPAGSSQQQQQQQQQQSQFQQYEPPTQQPSQKFEQPSQKTAMGYGNFNSFQMPNDHMMNSIPVSNQGHHGHFHAFDPRPGSSIESSPEAMAPPTPGYQGQEDLGYYMEHFEQSGVQASQAADLRFDFDANVRPMIKEEQSFPSDMIDPSLDWNANRNPLKALHHSCQSDPDYSFQQVGKYLQGNEESYYAYEQHAPTTSAAEQPGKPQSQFGSWHEALPYAAISTLDNDFDQESEADIQDQQLKRNDLGNLMALKAAQDNQNLALRSLSSFLDAPDMLANYHPTATPTPLEDPLTARVFLHFINVTGQNISLYDRHSADPGLMFSGRPVPHDNQHLWSYTMPTLALTQPALLHSMLAVSSLQMATLQGSSTIPSLKHYHIALRRVAKGLHSPRRGHPAILAATMLLGWYEVMSADHQKWTSHLLGAKQLIKEIGLREKSKEVNAIKKQRQEEYIHQYFQNPHHLSQRPLKEYDEQLDEEFIFAISGLKIDDDCHGTVLEEQEQERSDEHIRTDRDIEIYENQRDLFWWYCKQDVYQSILSGNELFIDFENWIDCPPRAPIGRWEAIYGTFDHLVLLLGRMASFASKDLVRKKKVMARNGGVWRPPPGMKMPGPPPGKPQNGQAGPPKPPQMPPFMGMMPTGGPATLPMGFEATRNEAAPTEEEESLEIQTAKALEEWKNIQTAFKTFADRLGDDFRPVKSFIPIETPFGPAYQFRSYPMAGIWMNYYMGLICHARSNPILPPAAHVAVGIVEAQTRAWSRELGRVCGGLMTPESEKELTTLHASALMEACVPMFTAAVQYQGQPEREWAVKKLRDIARYTGWSIAGVISSGCEGAWIKAAENGRGAPYKRPDGVLGAGHDRPGDPNRERAGGMYFGFDGNRIGVPRIMEEDGKYPGADEASKSLRRDRRAILCDNQDKETTTAKSLKDLNLKN